MMKARVAPKCSRVLRDFSMVLVLCVLAQLPAQAAVEKTVDRGLQFVTLL